MEMNRRAFIGTGALALAGSAARGEASDRAPGVFPALQGAEFAGHQADIISFVEACKAHGFGGFKAAMRYVGLDQGACLGPNRTLSDAEYAGLSAKLAKMDFVRVLGQK